jgi:hypothetical protein
MEAVDFSDWSRDDFVREIQRLHALLDGRFKDARLLSMAPDGKGAFVLDIQSGLSGVMAENMMAILRGEGAPNFVQVEANHPENGPLTFTIERRFGRSPAVQLAEEKAKTERLTRIMYETAHLAATLGSGATGWLRGRFMSISNALNVAIGRTQSSHGDQFDQDGVVIKRDQLDDA